MIECGFAHDALMAMSEDEFCFWLDERAQYDQLVKEAYEEQAAKPGKTTP